MLLRIFYTLANFKELVKFYVNVQIMTTKTIEPMSDVEEFESPVRKVKVAYLVLVHRFPEQFKRLFRAIFHPGNIYLIHIDKKAELGVFESIVEFITDFPNTHILERESVLWGGYSMVQTELNGIQYLLDLESDWDFFINLSGQDFPLQSPEFIQNFLGKNKQNNFIKTENQATNRPETMNRIENYFVETKLGYLGIPPKRNYLKNVTPYIGGQWMILTRDCCEFICNSTEVDKFKDFYLNTFIADEAFFQTVLMNTSFHGNIVNDDKRAIIWIADGDIKLRPKTFSIQDAPFLLEGDSLFARKFDKNFDEEVIELIENNLYAQTEIGEIPFFVPSSQSVIL